VVRYDEAPQPSSGPPAAVSGWIGRVTTDSMHLRTRVAAPPESVFEALTEPDELTEWLAESAEVALDEGRYEFWGRYAPQGDRPRQRLIEAEPGRLLRFAWDLGDGEPSTVNIRLDPDDEDADGGDADEGGSLVTVTHTGVPDPTALGCFWHVSLANLAAHCEGLQTMPPFDFSVPAQGDALVRIVIDVPADEVYTSLLDPAQVDKWAGGKAVIEPEVGGRYDFGWDHGPVKIVELEQDMVLAYSWRYPDTPDTTVRWTLRSSRGSTYLTLLHGEFADDRLAEQFRQGWPGFLVEIKRMLELGERWQSLRA
jgi:uncharacterized protein YndB with AHSA1/START domain